MHRDFGRYRNAGGHLGIDQVPVVWAYVHYSASSGYRRDNPLYRAERDAIRRFARSHGPRIAKTFCDPQPEKVGDLKRCNELARLFALAGNDVTVLLVAGITGIATSPVDCAFVLTHFRNRGAEVIDITTGRIVTHDTSIVENVLATATPAERAHGLRRVAALKAALMKSSILADESTVIIVRGLANSVELAEAPPRSARRNAWPIAALAPGFRLASSGG